MRNGHITAVTLARVSFVTIACLMLANCSSNSSLGKFNAKLGVKGSPRVVELGQPVPKGGGVYSVGKPYVIAGRTYVPREDPRYRGEGLASWYGEDFHGRLTANREVYDMDAISAAHPTLPLPSYGRVTNLMNGRSIVVRVNDRGPYHEGREIDLSMKAADLLGYKQRGTTRVRVEYVGRAPLEGTDDRQLLATLREGEAAPAPSAVRIASHAPQSGPYRGDLARRDDALAAPERAEFGREDSPRFAEPVRARSRTAQIRAEPLDEPDRGEPLPDRTVPRTSAYGPTRFDGTQSVATGRGLY